MGENFPIWEPEKNRIASAPSIRFIAHTVGRSEAMPEQTNATLTLLKAASTPFVAVGKGLSRVGSETGSLLTTGKTQSAREKEAAIKLQAASRGMLLRVYREKNKPPPGFFSCGSRGKNKDDNNSSWLCGCGGRGKKQRPNGPMPGLARPPSFPRREYPEEQSPSKATEDKM